MTDSKRDVAGQRLLSHAYARKLLRENGITPDEEDDAELKRLKDEYQALGDTDPANPAGDNWQGD